MRRRRGNPAWYRGMPSANPKGRPRGGNSIEAFCRDPEWFFIRHLRWWRFSWEHILTAANGAGAARRAGYSRKSARFIASRLLKKAIIRAKHNELVELTNYRAIPIPQGVRIIRCRYCKKPLLVNGLGANGDERPI
jgi:hypothetical protein